MKKETTKKQHQIKKYSNEGLSLSETLNYLKIYAKKTEKEGKKNDENDCKKIEINKKEIDKLKEENRKLKEEYARNLAKIMLDLRKTAQLKIIEVETR